MKRTKRFTLRRIALGFAVVAVVAPAAQAKPTSSHERQQTAVEIPYLSHGVGVSNVDFGQAAVADATVEIPYLSHGVGVSHMDFDRASKATGTISTEVPYLSNGGANVVVGPDDMVVSKPSNAGQPAVTGSRDGWHVGTATVSVFALAFALMAGSLLAVRHNRRTRLSPA